MITPEKKKVNMPLGQLAMFECFAKCSLRGRVCADINFCYFNLHSMLFGLCVFLLVVKGTKHLKSCSITMDVDIFD